MNWYPFDTQKCRMTFGSVRKIGEEQEESDGKQSKVLKNNWVGESHQMQLDLISRQEDVQVI